MIGKMRHRIQLQQQTEQRDAIGGAVLEWITYGSCWAAIEPLSGREMLAAQHENSTITTRIRIRYRDDVWAQHRVKFGSTVYNIQTVIDRDTRRQSLELMCDTGANDG